MKFKYSILLAIVLFTRCSPHEKEKEVLAILNTVYKDYSFSAFKVDDLHMRVDIRKNVVDSTEIRDIYDCYEGFRMNALTDDEPLSLWLFLVFYDQKGDYLFTVTRYNYEDDISFFRDGYN